MIARWFALFGGTLTGVFFFDDDDGSPDGEPRSGREVSALEPRSAQPRPVLAVGITRRHPARRRFDDTVPTGHSPVRESNVAVLGSPYHQCVGARDRPDSIRSLCNANAIVLGRGQGFEEFGLLHVDDGTTIRRERRPSGAAADRAAKKNSWMSSSVLRG